MPKKSVKKAKKGSIFEKDKNSEFEDEQDEFLDAEEREGTHAEHAMKIRVGDREENVYTEEGREELLEDDEISPAEEGFAEGEEENEEPMCARCEKIISDRESGVIEREVKGKLYLFCSEKCAKAGPKGKGK